MNGGFARNADVVVGRGIFDERDPPQGKTSGRQILRPASSTYLLRGWEASPDAFSTSLIFTVRYNKPFVLTDDPSDALARINFGSAAGLLHDDCADVDIDLLNGTAITVLGNCSLSVELIYGALLFGEIGATQPELVVDLAIAHGLNVTNARRTVKYGTIPANTTSAQSLIPNHAREALLVNNTAIVPALTIDQFFNPGNPVSISQTFVGKTSDTTAKLANGARTAALTTGVSPSTKTALIWYLNL